MVKKNVISMCPRIPFLSPALWSVVLGLSSACRRGFPDSCVTWLWERLGGKGRWEHTGQSLPWVVSPAWLHLPYGSAPTGQVCCGASHCPVTLAVDSGSPTASPWRSLLLFISGCLTISVWLPALLSITLVTNSLLWFFLIKKISSGFLVGLRLLQKGS